MAVNQRVRQRKTASNTTLPEEAEPIDESEQESIVTSLESDQVAQEKLGRRCLGGVLSVIFALHSYLAYCQIHQPWSTKQAAYFADLPASMVALGFSVSTAAYLLVLPQLFGVQWPIDRILSFQPATLVAALTSVFWLCILTVAVHARDEGWVPALKFWWLPTGPLAMVWLVKHFLRMFGGMRQDLQKLRTEMYPYKTA